MSRKLSLTHSHGKTSNDFHSVSLGHVFKEKVVSESMDLQYSEKRFYARVSLSSVFPPTAVWRAAVAEARSAMRRSCLAVDQFFSVIVPVEGIGNVVISSAEPLAVFSNFVREVVCRMKTCYFDLNGGLDGVLAILDKIRFPQPAF